MFCSVVIPTIGRQTLSKAVHSVLEQTFTSDDFEVIVVNDSGQRLPELGWQRSEKVRVVTTNQLERSIARNTGAAVAQAQYLLFLDDDDWLVPDALQHLWTLAQNNKAAWFYGSSQLVDRNLKPVLQLHHKLSGNCFLQVLAGEWIPLQASLIRSDAFFAVGGFNPLLVGPEDIDLLRRIALEYEVAGTEAVVVCVAMGEEGSTTDYDRHPERSRWAREMILDSPDVFKRMRDSVISSYWYGRIPRAYLTSMIWNIKRKRFLTAVSRAVYGLNGAFLAGANIFSLKYWQAVLKPYQSETFERGFQESKSTA